MKTASVISALIKRIDDCKGSPEIFFGEKLHENKTWTASELVRSEFLLCAKILHPDHNPGNAKAAQAMATLTQLRAAAEKKLEHGTYGVPDKPKVQIKTKTVYDDVTLLDAGDISDVYRAMSQSGAKVVIKLVRDPKDNDLADNEWLVLKRLHATTEAYNTFGRYLPKPVEKATVTVGKSKRRANILEEIPNVVSLEDVMNAHPSGLDPRDAAWMWRRLLEVLGWTHGCGLVHGAVQPKHFLVNTETHGGFLIDWSYAQETGKNLKAMATRCDIYYPPEVQTEKLVQARPAVDIYMAAMMMGDLLGHGWRKKSPKPIVALLDSCLLGPYHRQQTVADVYERFQEILKNLYGPPKFRKFEMPK